MKSWLQDNVMEMHSTHNEKKYVVTERFTRTLENQTYNNLTAISRSLYIDKLDDTVND